MHDGQAQARREGLREDGWEEEGERERERDGEAPPPRYEDVVAASASASASASAPPAGVNGRIREKGKTEDGVGR